MTDREMAIKGIQECNLNGGRIGNCPYKGIISMLKEQPEIVLCKDCKHRPKQTEPPKTYGFSIVFPKGNRCPCQCDDGYYSWYPPDEWFCANGEERKT